MKNKLNGQSVRNLIIRNAHIIDPANGINEVMDLHIKSHRIVKWGKDLAAEEAEILDAKKLHLLPGLIDMHVHFREPGYEHKETIETGALAAIAGGFVGCVSMPNTKPACDNAQVVKYQIERANIINFNLFPAGTLTQGREGKKISEMAEMKAAGAVAVTDDGNWVFDSGVARRTYEYAATYGLPILSHAEDQTIALNGVMNEGIVSTKLGLRGRPNAAEDIATARDIELVRLIKCQLHFQHVSTRGAVDMIRRAKAEGLPVTAEATPHHIALTDAEFLRYDTFYKMNPPLRTEEDRQAVLKGLEDGTIDVIATDHAPHAFEEKDLDIEQAPFGTIGLESAFGIAMTELYHGRKWKLEEIVKKMSLVPAEILKKQNFGRLKTGEQANFVLVDVNKEWTFSEENVHSKSLNSCFYGKKLKGKVLYTFAKGYQYAL
ncbi:MAG TPA: dihydroorotase [Candidatus Omnitrophota bacterium]|nr:dihydroorotase [Candidatus Omnitrophota bacterium]HRY85751.1 dihydroorotase [Candidatus Omnitrophota bacterium]